MDTKITPALQIDNKKNLSEEEFQKQLCTWLESRGLLCELRAYFRSNMIEVLKNTSLGSTISSKVKQTISPKMQAINLLIAEYFIYSQYHFSLCVFCTEVQLNNMLQNASNSTNNLEGKPFKFTDKEVYDILEAVGILRYNKQAQKIYESYCESDEPLILYFLPSGSLSSVNLCEPMQALEDVSAVDCDTVLQNIQKVLANSNMPPAEQTLLKHYIKLICDNQHEKHMKNLEALREQYKTELKKYKSKLGDIQKSFDIERKKLQNEIKLMERNLEAIIIQGYLLKNDDAAKPTKVISLSDQMQQKDVITGEIGISAEVASQDKSTQYFDEKPKKPMKFDKEQQTLVNASLETAVLKHVVQKLEEENNSLRVDNFNYCGQIDELANRASVLMAELNISQQNVVRLNNLLQSTPSVFSVGNVPENIQNRLRVTGAGEECLGAVRRTSPLSYRNIARTRKPSKKAPSSSENSSRNSTPTEDLLREARKKLKNLELESEDIDRRIRMFTETHDFAESLDQSKAEYSGGKHFKFNSEPCTVRESEIFEFGSGVVKKNTNIDLECNSNESLLSLTGVSISNDEI